MRSYGVVAKNGPFSAWQRKEDKSFGANVVVAARGAAR